jgi:C4-dicarboxylate transporter DctM subunit
MNTLIIFTLLVALMLTGMPISISLGLTVLSFLFFLTQVPIESVALKLFTGIEKFEIMPSRSSSWPATSSLTAAWPSA